MRKFLMCQLCVENKQEDKESCDSCGVTSIKRIVRPTNFKQDDEMFEAKDCGTCVTAGLRGALPSGGYPCADCYEMTDHSYSEFKYWTALDILKSAIKKASTVFLCPDCKTRCNIKRAGAIQEDTGRVICDECLENYSNGG